VRLDRLAHTFWMKIQEEDESGIETAICDNGFDPEIASGSITVHTRKQEAGRRH